MSLALHRPHVQTGAELRLQQHVNHLRDMVDRHALCELATWERIRETAIRVGYDPLEAEQIADRHVMGEPVF